MVKTLVALATERMLLKTSGPTFLRGIEFMYAAGLAPDRLSVMMTSSHKFVLQFHSKCDIRPFAANYPNFARVLRGIVHVRAWRIKSIEFVNVAFYMRDVDNLDRAIEKLGVELVLLRNCTYPGVSRGEEAVKFLSALNRKKQAVVCEYGDDRLKHRIARRSGSNRVRRPSRLLQDGALARLNADNNDRGGQDGAPVAAPDGDHIDGDRRDFPQPPSPDPGLVQPPANPPPINRAVEYQFEPRMVHAAIQFLGEQRRQRREEEEIPQMHPPNPPNNNEHIAAAAAAAAAAAGGGVVGGRRHYNLPAVFVAHALGNGNVVQNIGQYDIVYAVPVPAEGMRPNNAIQQQQQQQQQAQVVAAAAAAVAAVAGGGGGGQNEQREEVIVIEHLGPQQRVSNEQMDIQIHGMEQQNNGDAQENDNDESDSEEDEEEEDDGSVEMENADDRRNEQDVQEDADMEPFALSPPRIQ
ncbi:unnamed protein product [Caenorhabditis bovis]|uniref:Uncharacterized protein n=1 Tax=Caenorhabditis bovis TaxID=2654633 RepID=A0A8S1EXS8_9PELO|nr:unnamed protein product [Caenorhabditis bovis]